MFKVTVLGLFLVLGEVEAMTKQEVSRRIDAFFNQTKASNMVSQVADFYAKDIVFEDPLSQITGVKDLTEYYAKLYENLLSIHFEIKKLQFDGKDAFFTWQMEMKHKSLKGGAPISLAGMSEITFDGSKATYHRDYFDVSAMVYEHVPVLGPLMRFLKKKTAGH